MAFILTTELNLIYDVNNLYTISERLLYTFCYSFLSRPIRWLKLSIGFMSA